MPGMIPHGFGGVPFPSTLSRLQRCGIREASAAACGEPLLCGFERLGFCVGMWLHLGLGPSLWLSWIFHIWRRQTSMFIIFYEGLMMWDNLMLQWCPAHPRCHWPKSSNFLVVKWLLDILSGGLYYLVLRNHADRFRLFLGKPMFNQAKQHSEPDPQ
jgi:hypothetical protein